MNVKQGDIAIVIQSYAGKYVGIIVAVESYYGSQAYGPTWLVTTDRTVRLSNGQKAKPGTPFPCPDAWLRPVSGLPGEYDVAAEKNLDHTGAA